MKTIAFLVDHLVVASTDQPEPSLIEYLNDSAEEWEICHTPGDLGLGSHIEAATLVARALVQLKVSVCSSSLCVVTLLIHWIGTGQSSSEACRTAHDRAQQVGGGDTLYSQIPEDQVPLSPTQLFG